MEEGAKTSKNHLDEMFLTWTCSYTRRVCTGCVGETPETWSVLVDMTDSRKMTD